MCEAQQPQRSVRVVLVRHIVLWEVGRRERRQLAQPIRVRLSRQRQAVAEQQAAQQRGPGRRPRRDLGREAGEQRGHAAPLAGGQGLRLKIVIATTPRLAARSARVEVGCGRQVQQRRLLPAQQQAPLAAVFAPARQCSTAGGALGSVGGPTALLLASLPGAQARQGLVGLVGSPQGQPAFSTRMLCSTLPESAPLVLPPPSRPPATRTT